MSTPESIPLVKNIVDVNANVFESLKESAKNGTLEEYLSDKDISNLAYDAAQQDEKECLKILINQGVDLSVPVREKKTILNAIFDNVTNAEKFISKVLDSQVDLDKSNVYVLNFRLLRPEENKQMAVISNLCEATSDKTMINILQHPLLGNLDKLFFNTSDTIF
jgi:ankyrin repeat protein